jgi:hypothetical protein
MSLVYFTAILDMKAIVVPSSLGTDPDPFTQAITGIADFTPSVVQVWSELDERLYVIQPIRARIDHGVLADIPRRVLDDTVPAEVAPNPPDHRRYGIRLTANSEALGPIPAGLDWTVTFSRLVFDKADRKLLGFTFPAPDGDQVVDLATVHHRTDTRRKASAWL